MVPAVSDLGDRFDVFDHDLLADQSDPEPESERPVIDGDCQAVKEREGEKEDCDGQQDLRIFAAPGDSQQDNDRRYDDRYHQPCHLFVIISHCPLTNFRVSASPGEITSVPLKQNKFKNHYFSLDLFSESVVNINESYFGESRLHAVCSLKGPSQDRAYFLTVERVLARIPIPPVRIIRRIVKI